MKWTQIVFSPTGGTQKVVDLLASEWGDPVNTVDLTQAEGETNLELDKGDVAVIAVPSYGGRVPGLAAERIARLDGNQASCVLVCVYGNRAYEDTLVELSDLAQQSNFQVIAAISAVAEHSIMHQYAAGRPDAQDKKELCGFAEKILEKINSKDTAHMEELRIPGSRPYKKTGGGGLVPKAGSACTECGLCAEKCPAQAISRESIKTADSKKCISCMRCILQCPQSARSVSKAMVSVASLAIKKACSVRKNNEIYL